MLVFFDTKILALREQGGIYAPFGKPLTIRKDYGEIEYGGAIKDNKSVFVSTDKKLFKIIVEGTKIMMAG